MFPAWLSTLFYPAKVIDLKRDNAFAFLIDNKLIAGPLAGVVCVLSGVSPLAGDAPHPSPGEYQWGSGGFVAFAFFSFSLLIEVSPALEYLKGVELWSMELATGPRPVTLFSMLKVVTFLFLAFVAVRNLPGLLDLLWLTRTSADRGLRFAIATLSRYLILGGALIAAAGAIGLSWGRV